MLLVELLEGRRALAEVLDERFVERRGVWATASSNCSAVIFPSAIRASISSGFLSPAFSVVPRLLASGGTSTCSPSPAVRGSARITRGRMVVEEDERPERDSRSPSSISG